MSNYIFIREESMKSQKENSLTIDSIVAKTLDGEVVVTFVTNSASGKVLGMCASEEANVEPVIAALEKALCNDQSIHFTSVNTDNSRVYNDLRFENYLVSRTLSHSTASFENGRQSALSKLDSRVFEQITTAFSCLTTANVLSKNGSGMLGLLRPHSAL